MVWSIIGISEIGKLIIGESQGKVKLLLEFLEATEIVASVGSGKSNVIFLGGDYYKWPWK